MSPDPFDFALAEQISHCPEATAWSIEEADAWWGRHERGPVAATTPVNQTASQGHDLTIDLKR